MATITDFRDWLDQIDLSNYNTIYELYQAVETKESYGSFDIKPALGSDERWILKSYNTDDILLIGSEAARQTFLKIIDANYTDGMGIEGYYAYHHAMEKDD